LHAGASIIDDPEERLLTAADKIPRKIAVDWSVNKSSAFDQILTGLSQSNERNVTVHIWVANDIRLSDLTVPASFEIESAGEIDDFVKRHAIQK
jgi:hypothetical protein